MLIVGKKNNLMVH